MRETVQNQAQSPKYQRLPLKKSNVKMTMFATKKQTHSMTPR